MGRPGAGIKWSKRTSLQSRSRFIAAGGCKIHIPQVCMNIPPAAMYRKFYILKTPCRMYLSDAGMQTGGVALKQLQR